MMRVYRLEVDIDGFGGKLEDKYFESFKGAHKSLAQTPGFYYDESENKWDIEMIKETRVSGDINKGELQVLGIPYTQIERDSDLGGFYINYARATITPIDIKTTPDMKIDKLYVLGRRNGYNTYMSACIDGCERTSYSGENVFNQFHVLVMSFSKNYVKKLARTRYKRLARAWNNKEFDEKCNLLTGDGNDYLSIKEYDIKE